MPPRAVLRRARLALDDELKRAHVPDRPPGGWIRAVRQGLGLSGHQLAQRLGITRQSLAGLERSEADGSIRLATLRRAADAMDCDLAYVLIPRAGQGLDGVLRRRARESALREMTPVRHTMALEAQSVPAAQDDALLQELVEEMMANPQLIWASPQ